MRPICRFSRSCEEGRRRSDWVRDMCGVATPRKPAPGATETLRPRTSGISVELELATRVPACGGSTRAEGEGMNTTARCASCDSFGDPVSHGPKQGTWSSGLRR